MTYRDIIQDNCESNSAVPWWPRFAFHYTDVTNAADILASGRLYSRTRAERLGLMHNDNASRQVIDMTQTEATACVRFYFRPLTPTQYYNEGFKHPELRYYSDINANVPVPIFLLFDLNKLLAMPETKFSELPQSGSGSKLCNNVEDFAKLQFNMIYSHGYVDNFEQVKRYRHAEILYPNSFKIESCINAILCRNNVERTTLLNLLKEINSKAYYKYRSIIKICRENMFENNGLFIKECQYHAGKISITFFESYSKTNYAIRAMQRNSVSKLFPVSSRLELTWLNARGVCYHTAIETQVDYINTASIVFKNLPIVPGAKTIQMRFYLEEKLMCLVEQSLKTVELIK